MKLLEVNFFTFTRLLAYYLCSVHCGIYEILFMTENKILFASNVEKLFLVMFPLYCSFSPLVLLQLVRQPTLLLSNNILDLFLTSGEDRVGDVSALVPLSCCQYSSVVFQIP